MTDLSAELDAFVGELPKTAPGKIKRAELRARSAG